MKYYLKKALSSQQNQLIKIKLIKHHLPLKLLDYNNNNNKCNNS